MPANQLRLWLSGMAYVLVDSFRRIALRHTQFIDASVQTIRLKLLRLGAQVRTSVQTMRNKGQYRVARQTAPLLLRTVNQLSDTRLEAFDAEEWSDQLFNADGSLATTYPSHIEQHYIIDLIDGHWLVTQSELVRS